MDQKDLSLYLEEQRTELMSLNKGINQLTGLVQEQIDNYQPPISDVKVEGDVKVNTEKAVEVTNLEELQKWLGNLGETVTEAIETNKPEQVTEITVKNIADAQQPNIKVTNFKELSKFFDQLNDNIANLPQPYVNVEKQDVVFPTTANAPISVRLSDGKSFYNAITAYADANRVDTQGIINAVNNISVGSGTTWGISDIEATATYKYFGFQDASANWYIMRKTLATKKFEYVAGASAYSTAWTNRASQTYTDYATAF